MRTIRLLALAALAPCLAANAALQPMSDDELSQVHAAGLPDASIANLAAGMPLALADMPVAKLDMQDLQRSMDRQSAVNQYRFAAATVQGSMGLMQTATLPTLFTPLAPLFLPTLAMPLPFFNLPPKKPEPGH